MRFLIIGLGIYGTNLARDLVAMGHEVIGADSSRTIIDEIKDYITTAYVVDTTEETALGVLPLRNVDVVIVAIGENFGASIKTVALLKKVGVKTIYARAIDPLHESILQSFNVARILLPEQRAAADLTHEMALGSVTESLAVTADTFILKFKAPQFFVGLPYSDFDLAKDYGLTLVTVTRPYAKVNVMGMSQNSPQVLGNISADRVDSEDVWVVFGTLKNFRSLYRRLASD